MGCCGKKRRNKLNMNTKNIENNINFEEHPDFKLIKYYGGGTHTRFVTSPTRVLYEFGKQNYGMQKPSNEFWVHVEDIEATPNVFRVVELKQDDSHNLIKNNYNINIVVPETPTYSNTLKMLIDAGKLDGAKLENMEKVVLELIEQGVLDPAHYDTEYEEEEFIKLLIGDSESNNTFDGLSDDVRESVLHTEFAKLKDVHHLKIFNAYKNNELDGFKGENNKLYIYLDQEFEV